MLLTQYTQLFLGCALLRACSMNIFPAFGTSLETIPNCNLTSDGTLRKAPDNKSIYWSRNAVEADEYHWTIYYKTRKGIETINASIAEDESILCLYILFLQCTYNKPHYTNNGTDHHNISETNVSIKDKKKYNLDLITCHSMSL